MAKLWIREYTKVGVHPVERVGPTPVAREPGTDQAPLTFSTNEVSEAFGETTIYIGISADAAFHFAIGPAPEATTDSFPLPADQPFFFGVSPGDKIAVIAAA